MPKGGYLDYNIIKCSYQFAMARVLENFLFGRLAFLAAVSFVMSACKFSRGLLKGASGYCNCAKKKSALVHTESTEFRPLSSILPSLILTKKRKKSIMVARLIWGNLFRIPFPNPRRYLGITVFGSSIARRRCLYTAFLYRYLSNNVYPSN